MKLTCTGCNQQIDGPDLELPKIVNLPGVSMAVIAHPQQFNCPSCSAVLVHGISAMGAIGIVGIVLPANEIESKIIMPPNGMKLVRN
jgi:hypothetical protein